MDPLHLTATGAYTSLGKLVPAAAAARSGMANACALDVSGVPGGKAIRGVAGHAAPGIARSLQGAERLCVLLEHAAADLLATLRARGVALGRTGLYLGLPAGSDAHAPTRAAAKVAEALELTFTEHELFPTGRAGTARALAAACGALRQQRIDHAIVAGCESKLDPDKLAGAVAAGRLKCEDYPVGFIPGEGAALALLETRAAQPEALVAEPVLAEEEKSYQAGGPAQGNALADVLVRALQGREPEDGTVVLDLNGESYRASDWAVALVRASAQVPIARLRPELPVLRFGDIGAAYPVLAMGLAARAFARGYARGPLALICASADAGTRAAIVLRRPANA